MKPLINSVELVLFKGLLLLIKTIPKGLIHIVGSRFGMMLYYLGVRKSVVQKNLQIAFGNELSHVEIKKVFRQTYKNVGTLLFEFLKLNFIQPDEVKNYMDIEGLELIDTAIKAGKGVVLAGNHFGNWELFAAALAASGYPIHVYAGQQRNNLFDATLNQNRERFGMKTISKSKTATIEMIKVLKKNGLLVLAGDLNVPHKKQFVNFFNKKASIGQGLPLYTVKMKAPLFFLWSIRTGPFKHKGFIVPLEYTLTGVQSDDVSVVAQLISSKLEEIIREYPDQYFWLNKRWKTRPLDENQDIYSGN